MPECWELGPAAPIRIEGEVSELVDEHDLGSCAERRRSSSLLFPTDYQGTVNNPKPGRLRQAG